MCLTVISSEDNSRLKIGQIAYGGPFLETYKTNLPGMKLCDPIKNLKAKCDYLTHIYLKAGIF